MKEFVSLRAHLAQASNPLCQSLAEKRKFSLLESSTDVPGPHDPSQQSDSQPLSMPHNPPPVLTNEGPSLPEEGDSQPPTVEDGWEDEDDESDDEDDSTSDLGWEPPVLNDTDNMSISSDDVDSESGLPPDYVPPEDLRERTWVAPKVVKFPKSRAGEPIHSIASTDNTYATLLGNNSNSNPFHPFASKIDWEVAKWAKLQGPSSTSLMNLLKIEGVMPFHPNSYPIGFLILFHCRFMKGWASHTRPHANSIA